MNWQHVNAILWLRWRLGCRQFQRAGTLNAVLTVVLSVLAVLGAIGAFFGGVAFGLLVLPKSSASAILYVWGGLSTFFLVFWIIGLIAELQRSDALSFDKLLHYPVSLSFAFLANYVGSLLKISLILFVPAAVGLCIASVIVRGATMLVMFPLLAGFVLMVTAVTYQFRGWLAALMVNKRRRRAILAAVTAGLILVSQLPNLINLTVGRTYRQRERQKEQAEAREYSDEVRNLDELRKKQEVDFEEYKRRIATLDAARSNRRSPESGPLDQLDRWASLIAMIFPPGWLAYGAAAAARNEVWPGLVCAAGSFLVGAASLRRAHRTTLRYYRGELGAKGGARKKFRAASKRKPAAGLLGKKIPGIPDPAGVIALANLRSIVRAPEMKMAILTPLIMCVIFVPALSAGKSVDLPEPLRPLIALGALSMGSLGLIQLFQNQFGFDRDGFRTLVLSPSPRRDILLGKNLSLVPFSLGGGTLVAAALMIFLPMRLTHLAATLLQTINVHLVLCLMGNLTSIYVPTAIKAGSLRGAKTTFWVSFVHFLAALATSIVLAPLSIPLLIELLLWYLDWGTSVPVYLVLTILEVAGMWFVYQRFLDSQGNLLQSREQRILEAVTATGE